MNGLEKMYENAGVNKLTLGCYYKQSLCCKRCNHYKDNKNCKYQVVKETYPIFTAEKQLELIKWLVQNKRLCVRKAEYSNNFYMDTIINRSNGVDSKNFEVCLASQVNSLWQSLTEEERKQIKEILE